MNKYSLFFLSFILFFGCKSDNPKTEIKEEVASAPAPDENVDPYLKMLINFLDIKDEHLFRGINFDMTSEEVRKIERLFPTSRENASEKERELFFEVDLSEELLDFADLRYSFDEQGLYLINVSAYVTTEEKAFALNRYLNEYLSLRYGPATLAEDGFYEYLSSMNGRGIMISTKPVNIPPKGGNAGSYGFYLYFSFEE